MSWTQANNPICTHCASTPAIETIIEARKRDLGGFTGGGCFPRAHGGSSGPSSSSITWGRPSWHQGKGSTFARIHISTSLQSPTSLEGEIVHRDSLGSRQPIRPGAINWMTAGRGIVHSERTGPDLRQTGSRLHGVQLWVALPKAYEEVEPDFCHYGASALPALEEQGVRIRVLAGTAYGATSPVQTLSSLFYVEATMPQGAGLPLPGEHEERAAYIAQGVLWCGEERIEALRMVVFAPGSMPVLRAESPARVMLLGGAPMDGERHIWWNFVSSSIERIEQAKRDWKEGRFPKVPGEMEFIPLPEE